MAEKELESVMLKFIRDEADVLVATTIVENGLDIPRANTILINRADRLGLAELYQLRGRVGRSAQRAYAYLLVPPDTSLSEIARKRLAAMKEFSELAQDSASLRSIWNFAALATCSAASSMATSKPSASICTVKCWSAQFRSSRAKKSLPTFATTLNLGFDVRIPQDYIPAKIFACAPTNASPRSLRSDKQDVRKELEDRFGTPHFLRENLLEYCRLNHV